MGKSNKATKKSKHPRLGKIPDGWEVHSFSDVFEFLPTNSFSRDQMSYNGVKESVYNIHYGDIHATFNEQILDFGKHLHQIPVLNDNGVKFSEEAFLKDGDLIIADASEDYDGVGECIELTGINKRKVVAGLHTLAGRDKLGKTIQGFRAYILKHQRVFIELKKLATGSKVYGISKTNVSNLEIVIPPIPEQQRIARILSTWDKAIEKTEQLIAQTQQLKKGLMQQLLTGKVRFKEFVKSKKMKKTKLGLVPEDWECPYFRDIFNMNSGSTPSRSRPDYFKGNNLWVTSGELSHGVIMNTVEKISDQAIKDSSLTVYPKGTFMIAITGLEAAGTRGRCAILGRPATLNQSCMAFESRKDVDTWFLFYFYRNFSEGLTFSFAQGSKQQSLPKKVLDKILFIKPPIEEQKRISGTLLKVDNSIEKLEDRLRYMKSQKKGLMQKLLMGEVRVKTK